MKHISFGLRSFYTHIRVAPPYEAFLKGDDLPLTAAVEELLKEVK
ncbi:hypothetical protein ACFSQ3_10085 [Sphingobacterium corticis]|uniref:Uncharacterized protein n=1 Tax=Sphingobacterium corticis TaxID=1812823 RepID=A0ABW5NMU7_9SPHI